MTFDRGLHARIYSTSPLGRLNKEIKRRANIVGNFPNRAAVIRLLGALMLGRHDEWAVSRRLTLRESFTNARLHLWDEDRGTPLPFRRAHAPYLHA